MARHQRLLPNVTRILICCCLLAVPLYISGQNASPTPTPTPAPTPAPTPPASPLTPPSKKLSDDIKVYVSVMDPGIVQDVFGKRVAQRFVAIQVTIANQNQNFQFLIHDVSLDLKGVFGKEFADEISVEARNACEKCVVDCMNLENPVRIEEESKDVERTRLNKCRDNCSQSCRFGRFELSSLELSLIRGVAEKGQGEDTRNKTLRYFRAFGTIAAGLIGVASFGPSYPKTIAVFNGPVINAYSELYPDYTINQMNRLSDSAYKSNSLVPKQQAKVLVAFIPQAIFLTSEQRKKFWKDPTTLYPLRKQTTTGTSTTTTTTTNDTIDFRKAIALVDGSFITEIENLPPLVTGVHIDPAQALEFLKPRPVVEGYIVGQFLRDADIDLLNPPEGMAISLKGKPDDNRLYFIIRSDRRVPRTAVLNYRVFNNQGSQTISQSVTYMPPVPTLDTPAKPLEGVKGGPDVSITLTGTNILPDISRLVIDEESGVKVTDVKLTESPVGVKAVLKMTNAKEGVFKLRIKNDTTESNPIDFTVKKPSP